MASIVVSGDTSGAITLSAPSVAGTNTVTLPSSTGTMALLQTPSFATTIGVGGTTASASGSGISFPATQSASSDANTLDDYEEGTFTPTITGSSTAGTGTYTTQNGTYVKIGRSVTVFGYIRWSAHTGTGGIQINSLPFTSFSNTNNYSVASIFLQNMTLTAGYYAQALQVPNTAYIDLYQYPTGGTATTTISMDTSAEVGFSVTYLSAS